METRLPPRVRQRIQFYVTTIQSFNAAIADCQHMGTLFGSPGRYEWEYRADHEAQAEEARAALAQVEALATANQVSLAALYAPNERPTLVPWSPEALTWVRP